MTMPASTQRAHFKPSWRGDRLAAIDIVARRPLGRDGVRAIDMNFQWGGGQAWNIHWPDPLRNNYRFVVDGDRVRRMTRAELRRPVSQWPDGALRWRRGRKASSTRPHTYFECVSYAVRRGVVVCAELKSPLFATDAAARKVVQDARRASHPAWFMALINMKNCRGKCEAIVRNGGEFAVIFGKFRRLARRPPADWSRWNPKPTRLWGPAKWPLGQPDPTPVPAPDPPKEQPVVFEAPSPRYLGPAFRHSGGSNKPIKRIVIHSTVSPCEPGGAEKIAAYFRSAKAGGSAHYVVDPGEVVQVVFDGVVAWHAPPNQNSIGIEMCDIPSLIPGRWARKNQRAMLKRTATLVAELALAYDVPVERVKAGDLRNGAHGICGHTDVSQAFHQSTHWDPGYFPWRRFMKLVRAEVARLIAEQS